MAKKFYITTTLPYVNADPHIGFAMEIIRADTIARYRRLLGEKVIFNTGTDEHGLKILQKATEEKKSPQKYCDEKVINYLNLKKLLNLSFTNFIRTTDQSHILAAQEFWRRCYKNGDIYKAKYATKYCVGCELEKTDSELENGYCPIHPSLKIEIINEENYYFRFSKYQKKLLDLYQNSPDFVVPKFRLEEISSFVRSGLKDFSVSRLKEKMPWGISVPEGPKQVIYVWFEALVSYISTLGWPKEPKKFQDFWPAVQFAGKDNLRQQSAIWQAMLMSAGLPPSKQIYVEGFINSEGKKMSKSLGNVVNPFTVVKKYGTDAVRYYLLREIPSYSDGDFSEQRFKEVYNADLANGLGNLVARVAKLCDKSELNFKTTSAPKFFPQVEKSLKQFKFDDAIGFIWQQITKTDKIIDQEQPWNLDGKKLEIVLQKLVAKIRQIAFNLKPFLPQTAEIIKKQFSGPKIKSQKPLFPRIH